MSAPLDPGPVFQRLGRRIAELEVENAQLDAMVQQLAAQVADDDSPTSGARPEGA